MSNLRTLRASANRACTVSLLAALAGCATTGDPRSGGLFGWSEDQARDRQQALQRDDAAAQQQATQERQGTAQLQTRQAGLSDESTQLKYELDRLLAENTQLENQLRDLMQRRQLGSDELTRLRNVLASNQRLRSATLASTPKAKVGTAPALQVSTFNQQNGELHRELLILLQK